MSTTPFETLSTPFETLSTPIGYYNPDCVVTVKKTNKKTGVVTKWKVPSGRAHVVLNSQEVPIKTKLIKYKSYEMKYLQPGSTVTPPAPREMLPRPIAFVPNVPPAPKKLKRTYSTLNAEAVPMEKALDDPELYTQPPEAKKAKLHCDEELLL